MSREKITRMPVTPVGPPPSGASKAATHEAHDLAQEIVNTIGKDNLVDIKFLIEQSSGATREEILAVALKWVKSAEDKFAKKALLPLSH